MVGLSIVIAGVEITFHGKNSLFLSGLHLCVGLVNVILNEGQVLLSWVPKWQNVTVIGQHIVLKVLSCGRCALLPLLIGLVELNHFLVVEGVPGRQEHILLVVLVCLRLLRFSLSPALTILTNLVVVLVVLIFIFIALLPLVLAKFLVLILHFLVDSDLDLGEGYITTAAGTDNLFVDNAEVDFV